MFGRKRSPEKQHARDVATAKMRVSRLEWEHGRAVKAAQRKLDEAQGKPLLSLERARDLFGPTLKVYADRVETPKGKHPMTPDVAARVEGSGRSLVVLLEADEWGYTHDPHPDNTAKAHDFAREFNRLVQRLPCPEAPEVTSARDELERVKADRSEIETAQAELARLEATAPASA